MDNNIQLMLMEAVSNWKTNPLLAADRIETVSHRLLEIAESLRNPKNPFTSDNGIGDRIIIKVTKEDGTIKQSIDTGQQ